MKGKILLLFFAMVFFNFASVEAGHVSCGQTIYTDTVLDSDLSCTGTGLIIGANNITLDCDGHVIDGIDPLDYKGISMSNKQNVEIKNCNVQEFEYGIYLYSSSHNLLTNNSVSNNYLLWSWGIRLSSSSNNILTNNTASSNGNGIVLYPSSNNNILTGNTASNNGDGIGLSSSSNNNVLVDNSANSNYYDGIFLGWSSNNTLTGNTANSNNNYGIRLRNLSDSILTNNEASNNNYGIYLYSSSNNNLLTNNIASNNNNNGIYLELSSSNNLIYNNEANSNDNYGIYLEFSSNNNILTGNTANSNNNQGIRLYSSSNNHIYNNYFNNTNNARDSGTNFWDTTLDCSQPNIVGGPCIGGNFWHDYTGQDLNGDGIGDTNIPYTSGGNITNGGDFLPLVEGSIPPPTPPPVLLVHGYCSDPQDTWRGSYGFDFYQELVDEGKEVYLIDYAPGNCSWPYWGDGCANKDIRDYSNNLKNKINEIKQETGSPKVDIVAHSMGGLISRWYIQNSDYGNDVNQLIMLGTPNHGSQLSRLEWINSDTLPHPFIGCAGTGTAANQMKPKSTFNSMLNYDVPEFNWTIWQSNDEIAGSNVQYRNLAGTGNRTSLLKKVPKTFFERDGLDSTTTTLGDSVVATYLLRLIHPDVGCEEFQGLDHFQIHDNQNVFNNVLNFLNNPSQNQADLCNYEDTFFLGNITEKQGFSPMIYDTIYPNEEHLHSIVIDSTINETLFGVVWGDENSELGFTLITPSGNVIDETHPGFIGNLSGRKYYRIQNTESGNWSVNITGDNVPPSGLDYRTRASFMSSIYLQVESLNNEYSFDPGSNFEIIAYVVFNDSLVSVNMTAEIIRPDGSIDLITLFDDGLHNDLNASDGIYGNTYLPSILGSYEIFVTAEGVVNGETFARQFDMTNWVEVFPDLTLNSSDITFSNETPSEGEDVIITANIKNMGNGDALNATVFFYDGDPNEGGELIGENATNILINQSSEVSVLWTAIAGNHSLTIFPSPYNTFLDLNYSNEKASRMIYVEPTEYVSCGDTITSDTILGSDLLNCSGDGIIIGANNITLDCDGYTIQGLGSENGINLSYVQNAEIKNCRVESFYNGIYLYSSSNNTLTNNTANLNNESGIYLNSSSNNILSGNTGNMNQRGISLHSSLNNSLVGNIANSNTVIGIRLSSSSNNILTNNTASSNSRGIRLDSSSDNTLTSNIADSNTYFGIYLYDSSNNNILNDNTANSNDRGIHFDSSSGNILTNNTANSNSGDGILLEFSSGNTILSNTLTSNSANGIIISFSSSNLIYDNYFNNTNNAQASGSNSWNTTIDCTQTNIIGGQCIGGNFWQDYTGQDLNGDGIGDTNIPYTSNGNIQNGGDYLPLTDTSSGISCGDTITSDTILGNDLLNCSSDGIIIGANNITLDCDGHTIGGTGSYKGIYLSNKQNVEIRNCNLQDFWNGIYLNSSSGNALTNNIANSNSGDGIYLTSSSNNNILTNNTVLNNDNGINLDSSSNNNVLTSNTASSNNWYSIRLSSSSDNTLTGNTANSNNRTGIYLRSSSNNNVLTNNEANSNNDYGIHLYASSSNLIYNNYFNNTNNAFDNGVNSWNTTIDCTQTNIIGGQCIGGNFWQDYTGQDLNGDGIGDTNIPYTSNGNIQNGGDYLPLTNTTIPPPTCTTPTDGMTITQDTTFCEGTYNLPNGITIGADGITLEGNGSLLNGSFALTGILLDGRTGVTVNNVRVKNYYRGIGISNSNSSIFSNNIVNSNTRGFYLSSSSNNNFTGNFANSNNNSGIWLSSSSNNNVLVDNKANSNNNFGIYLSSSSNNNFIDNNVNSNVNSGFNLYDSSNGNVLTGNTARTNSANGIIISSSSDNLIYDNYFNNTNNARDSGTNFWNTTTDCTQPNIIGGLCVGGNFWHDYTGHDTDGDGIGDTNIPYTSNGNIVTGGDYLPLTNTIVNNTAPYITSTPVIDATLYTNYYYDVDADDPENDTLTYSLLISPDNNMTINSQTGEISWYVDINPYSNSTLNPRRWKVSVPVEVEVSDGYLTDSQDWEIIVVSV